MVRMYSYESVELVGLCEHVAKVVDGVTHETTMMPTVKVESSRSMT